LVAPSANVRALGHTILASLRDVPGYNFD
jgi:hypothetical protein